MAIHFRRSAGRHGISAERARYVVEHCGCPLYAADPDDVDVVLFLGPDANGVPLEVVGIERWTEELLVIHAMPLRRKYERLYAEVMRCR